MKPESWNVIARKHYRVVKAFKDAWHQATWAAIKEQKIQPVTKYPIKLNILAKWKEKRRRDIDALATKYAVDALVEHGILKGDDLRYINCVVFEGKTGQERDELIITIYEC